MGRFRRFSAQACAALLLSACTEKPPPPQTPDLTYLPAHSVVAGFVDTVRLRDTPFYREIQPPPTGEEGRFKEVREFLIRLGIDPDRDVRGVMFALLGGDEPPGDWVAVLRGRFDVAKIEKGLERPDARMSSERRGKRTIHHLVVVPDVGDISLAVLDPTAVAIGRGVALAKVVDVREGTSPSLAADAEMARLARGVEPPAQIWAVADGARASRFVRDPGAGMPEIAASLLKHLSTMRSGRFSAALAEDVAIGLEIESETQKDARTLSDALSGILALVRMGVVSRDRDTVRLLEGIRVVNDRATVAVRLRLTREDYESFRGKFGGPATPSGPPPAGR